MYNIQSTYSSYKWIDNKSIGCVQTVLNDWIDGTKGNLHTSIAFSWKMKENRKEKHCYCSLGTSKMVSTLCKWKKAHIHICDWIKWKRIKIRGKRSKALILITPMKLFRTLNTLEINSRMYYNWMIVYRVLCTETTDNMMVFVFSVQHLKRWLHHRVHLYKFRFIWYNTISWVLFFGWIIFPVNMCVYKCMRSILNTII